MEQERSPEARRLLLTAILLTVILAVSAAGLRPPAPQPADAPADQFSAARAGDALRRILGDGAPHPVGSAANAAVRDRILGELERLGYQPQVQSAFSCGDWGVCAMVNNIVARLDGSEPGGAVLLAAHYDSVPAGPGASDDGAGMATVLEIARLLKVLPPPRHAVIFLIDDGEEAGLLGARAFVDGHPWAKDVRVAVNLEARGTAGPSLMFETGSANEWAVRLYARGARRPAASSIFYTLYKQLPNDTDFTVFRAAGYQGLNFAYVGNEPQYHTPLDNLANLNLASLQHHGENATAMVLAAANADLTSLPQRDAVYFDVFGRAMIWWPAQRTALVALFVFLLVAAQVGWMVRSKRISLERVFWGLIAWFVTLAATAMLAVILWRVMGLAGVTPVNWVAHPEALEISFWALAIAASVFHAVLLARRAGYWGLWSGVWIWWTVLALLVAWQWPGFSYVLVVPSAAAALAGLPATLPSKDHPTASWFAVVVPLAAAGVVGFGPALLLYDGLGNRALVLISFFVGFLLTPAAPLCGEVRDMPTARRTAFLGVPIKATVLAILAAVVVPAYSAKAPERMNIEYWQDSDSGKTGWFVRPDSGQLPEAVRRAAAFRRSERGNPPWERRAGFAADAPAVNLPAPTLTILESTQTGRRRNYRVLLRSERGAPYAAALFPPDTDVASVRMEGQAVEQESSRAREFFNGWAVYGCPTIPPSGIELSFSLPAGKPVEISAVDQSPGLPAEGAFLLKARPATATPSQDGDVTIVSRRVEFIP